jgi:hypothetical protein
MNPLITTNQLQKLLDSGSNVLICDCRFDLSQTSAGREAYAKGQRDLCRSGRQSIGCQKTEPMVSTHFPVLIDEQSQG